MYIPAFLIGLLSSEGITIGAHRFYTHKSFKATPALRAVFLLFQTMAGQVRNIFLFSSDLDFKSLIKTK